MNVDDQPVGGHSGKKIVKVEPLYHDDVHDHHYSNSEDVDNGLPNERPIRPKANADYNDRDPLIEDADTVVAPVESFPPGQHPLEGIKDFNELPSPESLNTLSR